MVKVASCAGLNKKNIVRCKIPGDKKRQHERRDRVFCRYCKDSSKSGCGLCQENNSGKYGVMLHRVDWKSENDTTLVEKWVV